MHITPLDTAEILAKTALFEVSDAGRVTCRFSCMDTTFDQEASHNTSLGEMDRLTQLQDGIDELVYIMSVSLQYLTQKAAPKEVHSSYKLVPGKAESVDPSEFEAERKRLIHALLKEAKKVEFLISVAPSLPEQDPGYSELAPLQAEMEQVNKEFLAVLAEAARLQAELNGEYEKLLDNRPR